MPVPNRIDGRYEILEEIGGGAMGAVYKALDTRLERTVAIKTIRLDPNRTDVQDFRIRFDREAKLAGRLNHPNIVTVYDSGESDDIAFISMEFVPGTSLESLIKEDSRVSLEEAVHITVQVADALAYAHGQGVVHRDIKPGNIMRLESGQIKLTDFGISQLSNSDLTQSGVVLGTPKYMSPEQIVGSRVDGRSDIFSLGVVLYEMLTGRVPFQAPTLVSMMHTVLHTQPDIPSHWAPSVPPPIVSSLARCLSKLPEDRYASAADLAADLRRFPDLVADEKAIACVFSADAFPPVEVAHPKVIPDEFLRGDCVPARIDPVASALPLARRTSMRRQRWASGVIVGALLTLGIYAMARNESSLPVDSAPESSPRAQVLPVSMLTIAPIPAPKIKTVTVRPKKRRAKAVSDESQNAHVALGSSQTVPLAESVPRTYPITRDQVNAQARLAEQNNQIPRGESNILGR